MSRTPAATFARIKVQHPTWVITRDGATGDVVAVPRNSDDRRPEQRARSALLLEPILMLADDRARRPRTGRPPRRR